jgi:hypothetical protein
MHCASYCAPCQPLLRAFSGWVRSPPPTRKAQRGLALHAGFYTCVQVCTFLITLQFPYTYYERKILPVHSRPRPETNGTPQSLIPVAHLIMVRADTAAVFLDVGVWRRQMCSRESCLSWRVSVSPHRCVSRLVFHHVRNTEVPRSKETAPPTRTTIGP